MKDCKLEGHTLGSNDGVLLGSNEGFDDGPEDGLLLGCDEALVMALVMATHLVLHSDYWMVQVMVPNWAD